MAGSAPDLASIPEFMASAKVAKKAALGPDERGTQDPQASTVADAYTCKDFERLCESLVQGTGVPKSWGDLKASQMQ
ncbi:hypothetical protein GPECTOR_10g822 [Gonium pectorale]|uniref:Uncharacterized protein n=1 Tax=Gonium pectorale TaxID=33097 RepID=A0A150GR19_GONPE|nr:hypothetical protein GPECTOR_10g822 [Gonium pectorale]|eukprot:KXZ52192.1 hypothetical protein GPECTOR_10g822 [Gonium pectorale]